MRSSPEHKLSKSAIKAWRISTMLFMFSVILLPLIIWLFSMLDGNPISFWVMIPITTVLTITAGLATFFIPEVRWQRWFYQVDEHEIDLQSGIILRWFRLSVYSMLIPGRDPFYVPMVWPTLLFQLLQQRIEFRRWMKRLPMRYAIKFRNLPD